MREACFVLPYIAYAHPLYLTKINSKYIEGIPKHLVASNLMNMCSIRAIEPTEFH